MPSMCNKRCSIAFSDWRLYIPIKVVSSAHRSLCAPSKNRDANSAWTDAEPGGIMCSSSV